MHCDTLKCSLCIPICFPHKKDTSPVCWPKLTGVKLRRVWMLVAQFARPWGSLGIWAQPGQQRLEDGSHTAGCSSWWLVILVSFLWEVPGMFWKPQFKWRLRSPWEVVSWFQEQCGATTSQENWTVRSGSCRLAGLEQDPSAVKVWRWPPPGQWYV